MTFIDEENSFVEKETLADECKKGFSLAETMIMLVIVSIILAVSAPLITRKAAADAQRLIMQGASGGNSVVTALGGSQTLGIGLTNPENSLRFADNAGAVDDRIIKLHLDGNAILNGRVFIGGNNNLYLNNNGGIFEIRDRAADGTTSHTFQFNTTNGTANIATMPDYTRNFTRVMASPGNANFLAKENMYLFVPSVGMEVTILRGVPAGQIIEVGSPWSNANTDYTLNGHSTINVPDDGGNVDVYYPQLIPIPRDTYVNITNRSGVPLPDSRIYFYPAISVVNQ